MNEKSYACNLDLVVWHLSATFCLWNNNCIFYQTIVVYCRSMVHLCYNAPKLMDCWLIRQVRFKLFRIDGYFGVECVKDIASLTGSVWHRFTRTPVLLYIVIRTHCLIFFQWAPTRLELKALPQCSLTITVKCFLFCILLFLLFGIAF